MIDPFERNVNYLRISVTDRCNLRCVYCTPPYGIPLLSKNQILSYEEILRVVRIASRLGIEKIRLTGGEPLVRNGLMQFISALHKVNGLKDITLTTNGHYLKDMVFDLKKTGISRLNISLDSLRPDVFKKITRGGSLELVIEGIHEALRLDLRIKINVVMLKDINEREVFDFLSFGIQHNVEIRFIEFMSLGGSTSCKDYFVPLDSIHEKIMETIPLSDRGYDGVARIYQCDGTRIGFISSRTKRLCNRCSRLRLTADGFLRPCLFSNAGVNLLPLLRSETDDDEISEFFMQVIHLKPYSNHTSNESVLMRRIGG